MAAKKKTRKGKKKTTRRKKVAKGTPGRRLTPADQQRRLDALKRHATKGCPEPLTAAEIADKLGINVGTWNVWKSNQKKRTGGVSRRSTGRGRGRPRKAASGASLDTVIQSFRDIERERDQLRKVLDKVQKALSEAS